MLKQAFGGSRVWRLWKLVWTGSGGPLDWRLWRLRVEADLEAVEAVGAVEAVEAQVETVEARVEGRRVPRRGTLVRGR